MSTPEQNVHPKTASVGFGIVMIWLVAGFALAATVFVVAGWRMMTQIWLGSGIGLALLLLPDILRNRRRPVALPEPSDAPAPTPTT